MIGEVATHIPQDIRDQAPEIPWRQVIATRKRLIHGYLGIDEEILWRIIQDDMSELLVNLLNLIGELNGAEGKK